MKKLLSLLKKDAILVRRNKIWTAFEVLVPVVLLVCPMYFINNEMLLQYKRTYEIENSLRPVAGMSIPADLTKINTDLNLQSVTCNIDVQIDLQHIDSLDPRVTNRSEFIKEVRESETKCKPIGGLISSPDGIELIVPVSHFKLTTKEDDVISTGGDNVYMTYAAFIYQSLNSIFRRDAISKGYTPDVDKDELYRFKFFEKVTDDTMFAKISQVLSICLTLPVMNTARTVVGEKATIQPYLHSIGLSRVLFYTVHYMSAVIKTSSLLLLTSVAYNIVFPNFHPFWLLLGIFFYITTCISLSMFIAAFFTNPRRGLEGIVLVWIGHGLLLWFGPNSDKGFWHLVQCLNINQNIKNYFLSMEPHFVQDGGMDFTDGFSEGREHYYACYIYLSIMIIETVLLARLSIDVSSIAEKISNFVIKTFWKRKRNKEKARQPSEAELEAILLGEEVVEGRLEATSDIQLDNLIKVYSNGETAVNGLSMRAIRGQVSVLLGHNGCGKSTTFGMITGILEPTDGSISIEGIDAVENREAARESIGYCPQYNPLYEKLTVIEHLKLVNILKGGSTADFEEDADELLRQIGLTEKKNVMAKNLSGGMKRKLCVCMAMIGGSRVILLDEPTAGMDPGARLDVQNMLENLKRERTILLTTHYMDEAEKLGDWVFVMSHGKMAASGSIHYLKKRFGDGYIMTLVLEPDQDMEEAVSVLEGVFTSYVEEADIKDQRGQIIEISLPENQKDQFLPLFEALEAIIDKMFDSEKLGKLSEETVEKLKTLRIVATGLSMSSLEQVFITIGRGCDQAIYGIDDEEKRARAEAHFQQLTDAKREPRLEGSALKMLQYRALLYKRFIHLYNNVDQLIFQLFIPIVVFVILATKSWNASYDPSTVTHSSDLSYFPSSKILLQFEGTVDPRIEEYLFQFEHLEVEQIPFNVNVDQLLNNQTLKSKKIGMIIRLQLNKTILHFYEKSIDCLPIALTLLSNLKYLKISADQKIGTNTFRASFVPVDGVDQAVNTLYWCVFRLATGGLMLSYVVQPVIMFLIEEKMSKFLHQQLISGISPWVFWSGNVAWDFIMFSIVAIYGLGWYIFYGIFPEHHYLVIPTFFFYFFAYVSFVYLLSVFIKSPTAGSVFLTVHSTIGILVSFIVMLYYQQQMNRSYWYAFFDVSYIQTVALTKIYISQERNRYVYQQIQFQNFTFKSIFDFTGVWVDWIYFFLLGVLFFWFFAVIRSHTLKVWTSGCGRATPRPKKKYDFIETHSLTSEASVISVVSVSERQDNVVINAEDLVKDFGKKRAVNGLDLKVRRRECFGLLGQNGAGKTTTFDMLTGLTVPSGGSITISGEVITNRTEIGYCPQFDAMMEQYTGRQVLRIMACLQGYENHEEIVDLVLSAIGMTKHAGKQVKHCSGGQKRKLSVGIALLSRSQCVMLDEPTAGIDPRARREIWDVLHCLRERAHSSIVLTSHSMEECEALCTRIGVVREGEMIAMGTSQELKSKYGCFYVMTLVLRDLDQMESVKEAVIEKWSDAYLKSEPTLASLNMVYQLPRTSEDRWSETFLQVEELAAELELEDYMLTQATLEDAFLRLNAN